MIKLESGMSGEYLGVHLVRVTYENGEVKSVELAENIMLETDALGNTVSRPTEVVPVIACIGGPLVSVIPSPAGDMY